MSKICNCSLQACFLDRMNVGHTELASQLLCLCTIYVAHRDDAGLAPNSFPGR